MIYNTYETDGVPAPYDCELVDTQVRYIVVCPPAFPFNTFCTRAGITLDREGWHAFVAEHVGANATLTSNSWWWWYRAYTRAADAQDELDTQRDALR